MFYVPLNISHILALAFFPGSRALPFAVRYNRRDYRVTDSG